MVITTFPCLASEEKRDVLPSRIKLLDEGLKNESLKNLIQFGDSLFEKEDYYNALTIYQYALLKTKKNENLYFRIALCYQMGEQWQEAEKSFKEFLILFPHSKNAPEASFRIGQGYFNGKNYQQAIDSFKETTKTFPNSKYSIQSEYTIGLSYAQLGNWDLSKEEFQRLAKENPEHPFAKKANSIAQLLDQTGKIPRKSPWLAGFLSIVPGLGKVYTHHYFPALIALLINGGLGFIIYDSFDNDREAVGALFSVVAAATYSSNIIGGYRSAIRFNQRMNNEFSDQILREGYIPDLETQ